MKKYELENNAFEDIVKNLPETIRLNYIKIWNEYQKENSTESKIVHQIDRLEMVLQAKVYQKEKSLKDEEIKPFLESARKDITDPILKELFTKIIENK